MKPTKSNPLSFATLRKANRLRVGKFRNKHGQLAHTKLDGSDWSPSQWLQAMVGELGEFANIRKKFERGDLTMVEYEAMAKKELADVQIYLDLLASRALDFDGHSGDGQTIRFAHETGIDLGQAVFDKFNEVSVRVNAPVFLERTKQYVLSRNIEEVRVIEGDRVLQKNEQPVVADTNAAMPPFV